MCCALTSVFALSVPLTQFTFPFDFDAPGMLYVKVIPAFLIIGLCWAFQIFCRCFCGKFKDRIDSFMTSIFVNCDVLIGTALIAPAACVFEKERLPYIQADKDDPPLTCWTIDNYDETGAKTGDSTIWFKLGFFCFFALPGLCFMSVFCRLKNKAPAGDCSCCGCCGCCGEDQDEKRAVFFQGPWLIVELFCMTLSVTVTVFVGTLMDDTVTFDTIGLDVVQLKYVGMSVLLFLNAFQVFWIANPLDLSFITYPCNMHRVNVILFTSKVMDTWSCIIGFTVIEEGGNSDASGKVFLIGSVCISTWYSMYGPFLKRRYSKYANKTQWSACWGCLKSCGGLTGNDIADKAKGEGKKFLTPIHPKIFDDPEKTLGDACKCGIYGCG